MVAYLPVPTAMVMQAFAADDPVMQWLLLLNISVVYEGSRVETREALINGTLTWSWRLPEEIATRAPASEGLFRTQASCAVIASGTTAPQPRSAYATLGGAKRTVDSTPWH